jgi:hypothetical protein
MTSWSDKPRDLVQKLNYTHKTHELDIRLVLVLFLHLWRTPPKTCHESPWLYKSWDQSEFPIDSIVPDYYQYLNQKTFQVVPSPDRDQWVSVEIDPETITQRHFHMSCRHMNVRVRTRKTVKKSDKGAFLGSPQNRKTFSFVGLFETVVFVRWVTTRCCQNTFRC